MFSKKCKAHLEENGMTGIEHLKFAWKLAWICKKTAIGLVIHGLAPRLCQNVATKNLAQMNKMMED